MSVQALPRWPESLQVTCPRGCYVIGPLCTHAEMIEVERLQGEIWGYGRPGFSYPYPARCLMEFAESGGLVAGARFDGRLVGFVASWIGRLDRDNSLYLHSQLNGIALDFRNMGVGYHLKLYQRSFAQGHRLELIRWTFDPLQTRNAHLNIRKLGAVVRSYVRDYFGSLQSTVNASLPTDRFWAEWHINSPRVAACLQGECPITVSLSRCQAVTLVDQQGRLIEFQLNLSSQFLSVEVPPDSETMRLDQPELAADWQMKTRAIFEHYLAAGYLICDFVRSGERVYYVLERAGAGG